MKLLITGACGHIGSFILEQIHNVKKIKEVVLIDDFSGQRYEAILNLKNKIKYSFFNLDLSREKLKKFKKVDFVIHCASHTNAEGSFSNKSEMFRNNLNCMKNIIDYCKKNNSKLLHISSASVYGSKAKYVFEDNDDFLKPQSPYAEIKLLEEKLLKKNSSKIKFISFRFGTISGVSKGIRFHTAINKFCLNAALNRKISIYKTAFNQYRPYLSLRDVFKTFKFFIEKNIFNNNTYNVLSGNFTVSQIVRIIKKHKKGVKIKFIKTKIMNRLSYLVVNDKLRELGLKLDGSIESDIKETLKLFKNLKY